MFNTLEQGLARRIRGMLRAGTPLYIRKRSVVPQRSEIVVYRGNGPGTTPYDTTPMLSMFWYGWCSKIAWPLKWGLNESR